MRRGSEEAEVRGVASAVALERTLPRAWLGLFFRTQSPDGFADTFEHDRVNQPASVPCGRYVRDKVALADPHAPGCGLPRR